MMQASRDHLRCVGKIRAQSTGEAFRQDVIGMVQPGDLTSVVDSRLVENRPYLLIVLGRKPGLGGRTYAVIKPNHRAIQRGVEIRYLADQPSLRNGSWENS